MKLDRTSAVVDFRLQSRFESLRQKMLAETSPDRLAKPLAYWALPTDRRLPLAFLDRPVKDLLSTPFEDLHATPGVGQKKIHSLMKLLARAAKVQPQDDLPALDESETLAEESAQTDAALASNGFNPQAVSEATWVIWRATVTRHALGREPMGRYAPSLEHLPRVLWQTPLDTYTDLTLAEIRLLKTHGEKRVAAVLEVFDAIHKSLGKLSARESLAVRVVPRFVSELEAWMVDVLDRDGLNHDRLDNGIPSLKELRHLLVEPLLNQVRIDAGEQIAELAEGRLGLSGSDASVRQAARRLGLTRARVYQLLSDVGVMMHLRWPVGRYLVRQLRERFPADSTELQLLDAAADLFFPARGRPEPAHANGHHHTHDHDDMPLSRRAG